MPSELEGRLVVLSSRAVDRQLAEGNKTGPLAFWPGRAWLGWPALALPRGGNITELRAEIFCGLHPFDDRPQSILGAEI